MEHLEHYKKGGDFLAKSKLENWLNENDLLQITQWFREGATDKEVAVEHMGIGRTTFYRWIKESEALKAAVEEGKKPVEAIVEGALIKSATGFEVMEGRITADGKKVMVKKYIPPNITAIIYYLKNRNPKRWCDKLDFDMGNIVIPVIKNDIKE